MTWKTLGAAVALVVAGALAVGTPGVAASSTAPPRPPTSTTAPVAAAAAGPTLKKPLRRVLTKVNRQRTKRDLRPLRATTCLSAKVAQPWARHLARTEQLVHQEMGTIFETCSGLHLVGENIASGYATARAVMRAWMHSPGHRANILRKGFRKIGLGLAVSSNGTRYWVQDFGG